MKNALLIGLLLLTGSLLAQTGKVVGVVNADEGPLVYAAISLANTNQTVLSDQKGSFIIDKLPAGKYELVVGYLGYSDYRTSFSLAENELLKLEIRLERLDANINPIVVTGTKTFRHQKESPVMVHVLDAKSLSNLQANSLSEGLKYQPGLRVETDCQTCNYTQLRMNGLGGAYSQILINGRPIFSPLTGLYGMDQIPANMIDRIETIRGGASSLYGSNAIGGTVNIITRLPKKNTYGFQTNIQQIGGQSNENSQSVNISQLSKKGHAGISLFANHRNRQLYDHNGDGFSELSSLSNKSLGAKIFYLPKANHKLEFSFNLLREQRYGGEMGVQRTELAQQAEERVHRVGLYSLEYQVALNDQTNWVAYLGGQQTIREHYTGILPDDSLELANHLESPPFGNSKNYSLQAGTQLNYRPQKVFNSRNRFSFGLEYLMDDVLDQIPAYDFLVDQRSQNTGLFLQSDWNLRPRWNLLTGLRIDHHNFIDQLLVSPRLSMLFKANKRWQIRGGYSSGFRAPQAFDTDLHIAFAGGGVSRISLADDLKHERSHSTNLSINYDAAFERMIYGFTVEAFYTSLQRVFILESLGEDAFGERFEKRNGKEALVSGLTLEGRINLNQELQIESGITLQNSQHSTPVQYSDALPASRRFLRTPDHYGYLNLNWMATVHWSVNINAVYTGPMSLLHMGGSELQLEDSYEISDPFTEWSLRIEYLQKLSPNTGNLSLFAGAKNLFNAYQNDFDIGKNRDSNYVYGPNLPRSIFIGLAWELGN